MECQKADITLRSRIQASVHPGVADHGKPQVEGLGGPSATGIDGEGIVGPLRLLRSTVHTLKSSTHHYHSVASDSRLRYCTAYSLYHGP
jgi:hypothetical protein